MLLKDFQLGSGGEARTVNHSNPNEGRKLLQGVKCSGKLTLAPLCTVDGREPGGGEDLEVDAE